MANYAFWPFAPHREGCTLGAAQEVAVNEHLKLEARLDHNCSRVIVIIVQFVGQRPGFVGTWALWPEGVPSTLSPTP